MAITTVISKICYLLAPHTNILTFSKNISFYILLNFISTDSLFLRMELFLWKEF